MGVTRFVNGSALTEKNKVVYFIPKFTNDGLPVDLTVLEVLDTSETGRKSYEGYKANILVDKVKEWEVLTDGVETEENVTSAVVKHLRNALNQQDNFEMALGSPKNSPRILEFWKKGNDRNQKKCFGRLELETIELVPSMGRLLETIVSNLSEVSELNFQLQTSSMEILSKQSELETDLKNLVKDKSRMEDRMCRAFMKTLNSKKQRISELLKEIEHLKNKVERQKDEPSSSASATNNSNSKAKPANLPKKVVPAIVSDSSDESSKNKDNGADSSTDYDSETEVNDSDEEVKPVLANKPSKRRTKQYDCSQRSLSNSPVVKNRLQHERLSKCAQNLFPIENPVPGAGPELAAGIEASSKHNVSEASNKISSKFPVRKSSRRLDPNAKDKGNDMQWSQSSESSQELFPPLRKRKGAIMAASKPVPSTSRYKLRNNTNNKSNDMPDEPSSSNSVITNSNAGTNYNEDKNKEKSINADDIVPINNSQSKRRKSEEHDKNSSSPVGDDDILDQIFGDFD